MPDVRLADYDHLTAGERSPQGGWDLFCRCGWKSWSPTWESAWLKLGRHLRKVGQ